MKRLLFAAAASLALLAVALAATPRAQLRPFQRGSWQQIVASHAGRPTIVQFWGVTCGPCKVELPMLGDFMKAHPVIDMVTISADLVPDLPEATTSMLEKAGLGAAENWIFHDDFVERLRFEVDPQWQGDIPRTILISADGQSTILEGSVDREVVETWSDRQLPTGR
jgi:thiol-disulfide isomerase/thioredoxin